jgi:hypothetical protein
MFCISQHPFTLLQNGKQQCESSKHTNTYPFNHGLINNKDTKATCRHLKKNYLYRQVFICLRLPPLLGFVWGWSSNFVGSGSGQIQSVNFCRIRSSTGLNIPPCTHSQPHTVCIYNFFDFRKGRGEPERKLEGQ